MHINPEFSFICLILFVKSGDTNTVKNSLLVWHVVFFAFDQWYAGYLDQFSICCHRGMLSINPKDKTEKNMLIANMFLLSKRTEITWKLSP